MRKSGKIDLFILIIFLIMGSLNYKIWYDNSLQHPQFDKVLLHPLQINCTVLVPPLQDRKTCFVKLHQIVVSDLKLEFERKFILKTPYFIPNLFPGDSLKIDKGLLEKLAEPRNPGQFDYKSHLESKGVIGQISLFPDTRIEIVKSVSSWNFRSHFYRLRSYLEQKLRKSIDGQGAAFISAIILGKKESIPDSVREDFQNSGVAHVMAISGLHVGFVVYFFYLLLSFLPVSYRIQNSLLLLLLLFYMILSGLNPPVVRATIMVSVFLMGMNLERRPNVYNSLFAAIFIILWFQPQQLLWVSFQFSISAVLSILIFYQFFKPFEIRMTGMLPSGGIARKIATKVVQLFFVSLAAQLGTLPLTALYFKQIPIISLGLNLLVIPMVGLILPIGFLVLVTAFISENLAETLGALLFRLVDFLFDTVHLGADLPFSYLKISNLQFSDISIYVMLIVMAYSFRYEPLKKVRKPVLIVMVLLLSWKLMPFRGNLQLLMLDVGQGSSALVITPERKFILYDLGPAEKQYDSGVDVILPVLQSMGKLRVEKLLISHPHADHMAGLFSLAPEIAVDSVYLPDLRVPYYWQDRTTEFLRNERIPYRFLSRGDILKVDNSTQIYVLAPFLHNMHPTDFSGESINDLSLACLVKSDSTTILFTGDTEKGNEEQLLAWNDVLRSQILMVGHHGSQTSSSFDFLRAVSPQYGLISVGKNNHFDHPSPVVLQRLEVLDIHPFRTDLMGAVWMQSRYGKWEVVDWR
jgi:competence protein ComEC